MLYQEAPRLCLKADAWKAMAVAATEFDLDKARQLFFYAERI